MNRRKFLATTSVALSAALARRATARSSEDWQQTDSTQSDLWELSVEQPSRGPIPLTSFLLPGVGWTGALCDSTAGRKLLGLDRNGRCQQ